MSVYQNGRQQRGAEQEGAGHTQAELRQAVLTLAETVRGTVARERSDAAALQELIERLGAAAAHAPLESLQRTVRQTAEHLLRLSAQRERRQEVLAEYATRLAEQIRGPTMPAS